MFSLLNLNHFFILNLGTLLVVLLSLECSPSNLSICTELWWHQHLLIPVGGTSGST